MSAGNYIDEAAERAIVDRCRKNDLEAFGRLVDLYQARVFGFVRRMVSQPEEASDLTQEVFIRAFQSFGRFDGRSPVRTWLFRIAYNLCVDRARKLGRAPSLVEMHSSESDETVDLPDVRWQPEEFILNDELMQVVESAILSMSQKLRSVLLLHDREDMSYDQIAQILHIPVGTVKSRLFLARAYLQNSLKEYFGGGA